MRIAVHDFSGHPFQVQLSRELARRQHDVLHLHCPSYVSGKGALSQCCDDPPQFSIEGVSLNRPFEKYSPVRRLRHERAYGRRIAERLGRFNPGIVLSSNAPLFSQQMLLRACRATDTPFVFWQQDIYSVGMQSAVTALPFLRKRVGDLLTSLERRLLSVSDAVVVISEDFLPTLDAWRIDSQRVHVIHNWAPLDELPQVPRDNRWSEEHELTGKLTFLYSGTLGRKHDPDLLLQLALRYRDRPDVAVVVASEGEGSDWLRKRAAEEQLHNLRLVGFQPYDRLPEVLGSGDVLLVILEEDAGVFSVPSKVLSYQCAGRPILARVPAENLSHRIITGSRSGIAVSAGDESGYLDGADLLANDEQLREELGSNARRHAEEAFDIASITDNFEEVLEAAFRIRGVIARGRRTRLRAAGTVHLPLARGVGVRPSLRRDDE